MLRNADYLWSRHIIDSFESNDLELFERSLTSTLLDIRAVVEGGLYGTPYSIGEHAFFSENQFMQQKTAILKHQQKIIELSSHLIASENDWEKTEQEADKVAYYGMHTYVHVTPGDSFLMLGKFRILTLKCFDMHFVSVIHRLRLCICMISQFLIIFHITMISPVIAISAAYVIIILKV